MGAVELVECTQTLCTYSNDVLFRDPRDAQTQEYILEVFF